MIIVLEGPDGAGKTTLAQALVRASGGKAHYIHATRPVVQWPYARDIIDRAILNELRGEDTIIDRLWISDNIYWHLDPNRGRSGIHVRRQESVLNRFGAINVMCCPEVEPLFTEYKRLCEERSELYGKKFGGIKLTMQLYRKLWTGANELPPECTDQPPQYTNQLTRFYRWSDHPLVVHYDRFAVDPWTWTKQVWPLFRSIAAPFKAADPVRLLRPTDEWLNLSGSLLTCKALLVGERAGRLNKPMGWPFFSDEGSSGYLTASLHRAEVPEIDVALVNAYTTRSMSLVPLRKCLNWLQERRPGTPTIALGQLASQALEDLRWDHTSIPHPQWARRFMHHGNYHEQLKDAIHGRLRDWPVLRNLAPAEGSWD